jgi:hypothetical protein
LKREPAVVVLEPREVSGDGDRLAVGSTLPTPPMQPTR